MNWISIAAGAMAGFISVLSFDWIMKSRKTLKDTNPKLYCSLCWRDGSYQDIYDHVRLDHGLWAPVTAEAYPELMRLGARVAAALNKKGEVYRQEVWTTNAIEKSILILSPPMVKSLSEMSIEEFEHLIRIYS